MEYRSAFFDGVRRILEMTAGKDPRVLSWLIGLVGGEAVGVDPIEARIDFGLFAHTTLRRAPLRAADVRLVNEMIFYQQRNQTSLVLYHSPTGTQWEWDGNPLCHAVVCALGCEASKRLEDEAEYAVCVALECGALDAIAGRSASTQNDLSRRARERAARLTRQHDVSAALAALESTVPGTP